MKKIFKLFFFSIALVFGLVCNVDALTQDQVITRIKSAEAEAKELVSTITTWSNNYAADVEALLTKDFLNKVTDLTFSEEIDLVVKELKDSGKTEASNALKAIKSSIVNDMKYIKETLDITEEYLKANVSGGVPGSTDLFIQIRDSVKGLKNPVKELVNIYYDMYYDYAKAEIDKIDSVGEARKLYNDMLDKIAELDTIVTKAEAKLSSWQDLYNDYHMEDYEDFIKENVQDYYDRLREDYYKLYAKAEAKLQNKLDEKITVIVNDTDLNNYNSVMNRNDKLYDIIDYINDVKEEASSKFSKINSYIKIAKLKTIAQDYQDEVIDRLTEAVEYTKTYLIDNLTIDVRNAADRSFIKIDTENEVIVYSGEDLKATNFIKKLVVNYGDIKSANTYNGNIGTLSKVQVVYNSNILKNLTIIVKGDVNPSGRIDITDVVNICNKMFGKLNLSEYQFIAADLNNDGKIDITDIVKLCNMLFK